MDLNEIIKDLPLKSDPNLLVGMLNCDDAGVYKINDELALVQTVDFITPVVDDPYTFGQIAAANSLSDIFAMGATAVSALNLVSHDAVNLTKKHLNEILKGALDKVHEAGAVVVGGHTIIDTEMKYGLSVTGTMHPNNIIRNNNAKIGDNLILTKPLGTGLISTAGKQDKAPQELMEKAIFHMSFLNQTASKIAQEVGASAMTDVTGYGLLGHLFEMTNQNISMKINSHKIPFIPGAKKLAKTDLFPGGTRSNKKFYQKYVTITNKEISKEELMLMYDAQTSGGLLIAVSPEKTAPLINKLNKAGLSWSKNIGIVTQRKYKPIELI